MRLAYFTAGSVGAGHVVRGLALQRGLERAGFDGEYRMFGPPTPFARGPYQEVSIDGRELIEPDRAARSELAAALRGFAPDLLIVDLFWAPLRFILPLPGAEAWLLVRKVPSVWFKGPLRAPFEPLQYRRVIAIEPLEHPALRERIDPLVICNPSECEPPGALRRRLGVGEGERLVVTSHAGEPGEVESLRASGAAVFDLRVAEPLFPLARWLADADEIHCGAGYNSFWEARWIGYFDRARFRAFPRQIDDQAWRLRSCASVPMLENGADTLARSVRG